VGGPFASPGPPPRTASLSPLPPLLSLAGGTHLVGPSPTLSQTRARGWAWPRCGAAAVHLGPTRLGPPLPLFKARTWALATPTRSRHLRSPKP
jgi:hypothetical protein